MPPKTRKREADDQVYSSKPALKQKKFPARRRSARSPVLQDDKELEPARKRRKCQTTMTQLDFGRRSFLDAIDDSEEDDIPGTRDRSPVAVPAPTHKPRRTSRRSVLPGKTESQHTLTQLVNDATHTSTLIPDDPASELEEPIRVRIEKPKAQIRSRRNNAPGRCSLLRKTESQDTMTQFVKRSSDVSKMEISDSEEEDTGTADEVEPAGEAPSHGTPFGEVTLAGLSTEAPSRDTPIGEEKLAGLSTTSQSRSQPVSPIRPARVARTSPVPRLQQDQDDMPTPQPRPRFKTPKRTRFLPVPSSRSPPDSPLSTQVTPRHPITAEFRSPLAERSINIRSTPATRSQALLSKLCSTQKPSSNFSHLDQTAGEDSPTRRRVRDFNERFAMLEEQNAGLRSRRPRDVATKPLMIRSSTSLSSRQELEEVPPVHLETQYPALGEDTQLQFITALDEARAIVERQEPNEFVSHGLDEFPEPILEPAHASEHMGRERLAMAPQALESSKQAEALKDEARLAQHARVSPEADEIIIPSSQEPMRNHDQAKISTEVLTISSSHEPQSSTWLPTQKDASSQADMPKSTSTANTAVAVPTQDKNTQDLASDQLFRETQAYKSLVPSSPPPAAYSLKRDSEQHTALPRPSQATTVDETLPPSTFRAQHANDNLPDPPQEVRVFVMSSSPILGPMDDDDGVDVEADEPVQISESPLRAPSALPDVSSSLGPPEPKTPRLLRNLSAPLTTSQLISESLDYSIAMPPQWPYDEDEEDDDDEL